MYNLSSQQLEEILKYGDARQLFQQVSSCASQISICLLILRLLGRANARTSRLFLYALILILFLVNLLNIVTLIVHCRLLKNLSFESSCQSSGVQKGLGYMQAGLIYAYILCGNTLMSYQASQCSWPLRFRSSRYSLYVTCI